MSTAILNSRPRHIHGSCADSRARSSSNRLSLFFSASSSFSPNCWTRRVARSSMCSSSFLKMRPSEFSQRHSRCFHRSSRRCHFWCIRWSFRCSHCRNAGDGAGVRGGGASGGIAPPPHHSIPSRILIALCGAILRGVMPCVYVFTGLTLSIRRSSSGGPTQRRRCERRT